MLHFKASKLAILAAICGLGIGGSARATEVAGSFSGIIYNYNGDAVSIPIVGEFSYDTTLYQLETCSFPQCSLFAPVSNNAVSLTETSSVGTFVFNMAEGHGIFLETFQLNFGAAGAVFPTDETSIDMIFPHNVFTLGTIPVSFSGTFAPYQGSNEALKRSIF
jgi:hypothetical protein